MYGMFEIKNTATTDVLDPNIILLGGYIVFEIKTSVKPGKENNGSQLRKICTP